MKDGTSSLLAPLSVGTPSGLDLCTPWTYCHCLCECIHVPVRLFLEGLVSVVSSIPNSFYNLSASSSTVFPHLWGEKFAGNIPFSNGYSDFKVLNLFVPIYCGWKLLWQWLNKTMICFQTSASLLFFCSFLRWIANNEAGERIGATGEKEKRNRRHSGEEDKGSRKEGTSHSARREILKM